jgi:hypothetical protein
LILRPASIGGNFRHIGRLEILKLLPKLVKFIYLAHTVQLFLGWI